MEIHHIDAKATGGPDEYDNGIAVCFECHAEIASYNDQHPRGRKFHPNELRLHKKEWLRICKEHPEALLNAPRDIHVGPLQAMVDELEYNIVAAEQLTSVLQVNPKT
jgi:hypothetical protein